MSTDFNCEFCNYSIPRAASRCPHCGRPGLYPNVREAEGDDEASALERRYKEAKTDAANRRAGPELQGFEEAVKASSAVLTRSINELHRLTTSDQELYATYYQLLDSGIRSHAGDRWSILRAVADEALFPGYKKDIRFGALTLNGHGLLNYGECSLMLRDDMISHRSTVFEENSTLFMRRHGIEAAETDSLPKGYRANWANRDKLCVAKMAPRISSQTTEEAYPKLLLSQGKDSEQDDFVEVHIWGSFTARSLKRVMVSSWVFDEGVNLIFDAISERLSRAGVELKVG